MASNSVLSSAGVAFERAILQMGVPSRRDEGWRWSDLKAALPPEGIRELAALVRDDLDVEEFEFGAQAGIIIESLAEGLAQVHDAPGIPPGRRSLGAGGSAHYQTVSQGHLIFVDVIDAHGGVAAHWHGLQVRQGAEVTRIVIQRGDGIVLYRNSVEVHSGARYRQFTLTEGAKFARFETHLELERADADVEINGVYLCDEGRHADLTSVVTHIAANGKTKQLIKGVARKGGRGVFQGKIVVERGAQKTDARQYHHGMLLEEGAEIFAKPELMIHADDVACAHGNTAGGLDENALFYLRSRGVPEAEARALLIEAFLLEAVPEWLPVEVRGEVETRIGAWLRSGA